MSIPLQSRASLGRNAVMHGAHYVGHDPVTGINPQRQNMGGPAVSASAAAMSAPTGSK